MDTALIIKFFIATIAIINPIGNSPLFLEQIKNEDSKVQIATALLVALTSFTLMIVFFFTGTEVLAFFGVTLPAFRIAGGIILLMMGLRMIHGHNKASIEKLKLSEKETPFEEAKKELSKILVPIVIPILVGPGTITTVILYSNETTSLLTKSGMIGALAACCLILFIVFASSRWFYKILGDNGFQIFIRLMGLIICAIAVQFMIDGVSQLLPDIINSNFSHAI